MNSKAPATELESGTLEHLELTATTSGTPGDDGTGISTSSRSASLARPPVNTAALSNLGLSTLPVDYLSELPLDIFCEILALVHPRDLLRLSRTSKWLRSFLLSKERSRVMVWQRVFKSTEQLPPCPDELDEPEFANVLLGTICSECNREDLGLDLCRIIRDVRHYAVICFDCREHRFVPLKDLPFKVPDDFGQMCPSWGAPDRPSTRYHIETMRVLKAAYDEKENEEAKSRWINNMLVGLKRREKLEGACKRFFKFEREQLYELEERMYRERKERIIKRLQSIGWEKESSTFFEGTRVPLSELKADHRKMYDEKTVDRLTDEEWRRIEGEMVALMEAERAYQTRRATRSAMKERLDKWFKPAYSAYVFSKPANTVFPSALEVAMMPEWRDALCTGFSITGEAAPPAALLERAIDAMPGFVEELMEERVLELLDVVRRSKTYEARPESVTLETLSLASTFFRCPRPCHEKLPYPAVLAHKCHSTSWYQGSMSNWRKGGSSDSDDSPGRRKPGFSDLEPRNLSEQAIIDALTTVGQHTSTWGGWNDLAFDDDVHDHMLDILDALGWSRTTTTAEMEERQPYVECLCECYHTKSKDPFVKTPLLEEHGPNARKAMRWEKAIHHCRTHVEPATCRNTKMFAALKEEHLVIAQDYEEKREGSPNNACFYCMYYATDHYYWSYLKGTFSAHLERHGIEHPDGKEALDGYLKNHKANPSRECWIYNEKAFILT